MQTEGSIEISDWTAITGSATLTPNAIYYLSTTAGRLTTAPPTTVGQVVQPVGIAVSSVKLELEVEDAILL